MFALIVSISLLLVGCSSDEQPAASDATNSQTSSAKQEGGYKWLYDFEDEKGLNDSERFDRYTKAMFKEEVSSDTLNLHFVLAHPENFGIDSYEVTLGGYDKNDRAEAIEDQKKLEEDLKKFKKKKLTTEQQITYDILTDYLAREKTAENLYYYGDVFSPLSGIQQMIPVLLAEYTFREQKDVDEYLELVSQLGDYFDSYIVFEKEKVDEGLGVPDFALKETIEGCEDFIKKPEDNYLISTFDERVDNLSFLSDAEKKDYKEKNKNLIINDVCPAYEKLINDLESFKGKGTNDLGLYYFDHGKEFYVYKMRANVGCDWSMSKVRSTMEDYINENLGYIYDQVTEDPSIMDEWEDCKCTINDPYEIMEFLIKQNQKDFPVLEKVDYEIKSVPKELEDHINPAFYLTAPIDDVNDNVIYINHKYDDREELFSTLAHEGYPGHLYQLVLSSTYERNLARNIFSFSGYTEGFATYAEMNSYDYAPLTNKKLAGVMRAENEINLGIAAYVDLNVNYYGWDVEDTKEFLDQLDMSGSAEELFEAVVEDPAEYMEYFIGYLEFLELREKAETALGDRFDLCAFHEFLLKTGAAPFYIVDDYMDQWIKEQK